MKPRHTSGAAMRARLGTALVLASVLPAAAARANRGGGGGGGMLDAARSEVHGGSSSHSSSSSSSSSPSSYSSSSDSASYYDGTSAYSGAGGPVPAVTRAPVATSLRNEPWYFRRYPYEGGRPGHLLFLGELGPSDPAQPPAAPPAPRPVSVQLGLELGYDLAGVYRPAARVRLETRWLVGLEAGWTHLIEPLPHSGPAPGRARSVDHFGVGDVSALVHARWNHATIWSGLGLRMLADVNRPSGGGGGGGASLGWAGAVGLRLFPVRPLIVNTRLDFGSLGEASVLRARIELGAALRRFELYGGYDYFAIGDVKFHGPLAGLRSWL
ncbi:MAG: hypothetical protein U1A78_24815 [Polyangia bacterium]